MRAETPLGFDILVWALTSRRCIRYSAIYGNELCHFNHYEKGRVKMCYSIPWQYHIQPIYLRSKQCVLKKTSEKASISVLFLSIDQTYIESLSIRERKEVVFVIEGKSDAIDLSVARMLSTLSTVQVMLHIERAVRKEYEKRPLVGNQAYSALGRLQSCPSSNFPHNTSSSLPCYLLTISSTTKAFAWALCHSLLRSSSFWSQAIGDAVYTG